MTINEMIYKRGVDLLNTLTKYPSILTYHKFSEDRILENSLSEGQSFGDTEVCEISEKIDGTNTRIISFHDDFVIGSREQLLFAKGDRFADPALSIVKTVKNTAQTINDVLKNDGMFHVVFGETYGGNVTQGSKNYTSDKTFSFRIFDKLTLSLDELDSYLSEDLSMIAGKREQGRFRFDSVDNLVEFGAKIHVSTVEYYPEVVGSEIPKTVEETWEWLQAFRTSRSGINSNGPSEGVVIRTKDRRMIRKIRFEDYERIEKRRSR